jgi:hypothetical protein
MDCSYCLKCSNYLFDLCRLVDSLPNFTQGRGYSVDSRIVGYHAHLASGFGSRNPSSIGGRESLTAAPLSLLFSSSSTGHCLSKIVRLVPIFEWMQEAVPTLTHPSLILTFPAQFKLAASCSMS